MGSTIGTVALVAAASVGIYLVALLGVRIAGRRTVANISAFDFVVTVAIGTIVGGIATRPGLWLEGVTAIAALLGMKTLVAAIRLRSHRFRRLVDFSPLIIVRHGRALDDNLRKPQMSEADLEAKLRQKGVHSIDRVDEAMLESTGELSIVPAPSSPAGDEGVPPTEIGSTGQDAISLNSGGSLSNSR